MDCGAGLDGAAGFSGIGPQEATSNARLTTKRFWRIEDCTLLTLNQKKQLENLPFPLYVTR
jgi:hypothetical protein